MIQLDPQTAQDTWARFLAGEPLPAAEAFAAALGDSFLAATAEDPAAARPYLELLCAMATQAEAALAGPATATLFGTIIEKFCDDFSHRGVELANQVLVAILGWVRRTPQGALLDRQLTARGFHKDQDILDHYRKLRQPHPLDPARQAKIKKILILSRVTAGADIHITSVIIERLHQALPQAQLLLIGPRHLGELFGSLSYIGWRPFEYRNRGNLFDKMTSWPPLLALVEKELAGLTAEEAILIDPDSRLSQLGLLPLLAEEQTYYFNSRAMGEGSNLSLSALANQWLDQFLGPAPFQYPRLTIADPGRHCQRFCAQLRANGCRFLVLLNWGVGHNLAKRIPDPFEEELLLALLAEPGTILLLDSGASERCAAQVQHLLGVAAAHHFPARFLNEAELQPGAIPFAHGAIGLKGSLVTLGACIAQADLFLGYDSCPQHLAAAVGTEAIILFAGAPSPRFIARWQPDNPRLSAIPIPNHGQGLAEQKALLAEVCRRVALCRKKAGKEDATFR